MNFSRYIKFINFLRPYKSVERKIYLFFNQAEHQLIYLHDKKIYWWQATFVNTVSRNHNESTTCANVSTRELS